MTQKTTSFNTKEALRIWAPVLLAGTLIASLSLYWFNECNSKTFLLFAGLMTLVACVLVFLYRKECFSTKRNACASFACVLALFGLFYTFAFPPLTVPDEAYHFYSSYWLADTLTGQADETGFFVNTKDWELFTERNNDAVDADDYRIITQEFELFQSDNTVVSVDYFQFSLGSENLPARIATTLAILIGKTLGLGTYPLFYLGRLLNVTLFTICAVLAYRVIPFGKNVVVAVSLLPMTLHLTASYSYDVGIISLGMLLTALMLKAIVENGKMSARLKIAIVLVSTLLAPCKVIYSTLLFLVFLVPMSRFATRRDALMFKFAVLALPALTVMGLRMASIGNLASSTATLDYRGAESGHFYDLTFIFQQPLTAIALFVRTFIVLGDFLWSSALGRSLGWFQANIAVPYFYCIPLLIGIFFSAQRDSEDDFKIPCVLKTTLLAIAALSFGACMITMLIGHTFDTEGTIQGVQGRYILPVALSLILALRSSSIKIERDYLPSAILLFSLTNIIFLLHIVASALI